MKTKGNDAYERRRFGGLTVQVWTYSGRVTTTGDRRHTSAADRDYAEWWVGDVLVGWDFMAIGWKSLEDRAEIRRRLWGRD